GDERTAGLVHGVRGRTGERRRVHVLGRLGGGGVRQAAAVVLGGGEGIRGGGELLRDLPDDGQQPGGHAGGDAGVGAHRAAGGGADVGADGGAGGGDRADPGRRGGVGERAAGVPGEDEPRVRGLGQPQLRLRVELARGGAGGRRDGAGGCGRGGDDRRLRDAGA